MTWKWLVVIASLAGLFVGMAHLPSAKMGDPEPTFRAIASLSQTGPGLSVGNSAPKLSLEHLDGSDLTLSDQKTKVLIFIRTGCAACQQEMANLEGWLRAHPADSYPFHLLLVSSEEITTLQQAAHSYGITLYHDPSGSMEGQFNVNGSPFLYVLDGQGIIKARWPGLVRVGGQDITLALLDFLMEGSF